ncbi:uncharacterized protein JNUCC1_01819 [Lentibacillus sp. JNUCC-1]|uniref:G5 and 3D domain-containing protein n=1 Tax=Lentibacillus sp. JNUCC-1 TaxID=2654513 RepID=UPI0012E785FD|nr:G5 and 3D domain-containing protein [Lentibacillus sp. JNUCC-1]MUV38011.1 uncharacterized protein [Lentibacillus sp. JNUCC-1]
MKNISKLLPAAKLKLVVSGIGVMMLALFAGYMVYESSKAEVTVHANDETQTVNTHADTVSVLLDDIDIAVGEHDYLSHAPEDKVEDGMTIDYETAKEVTLSIDGEDKTYYTTTETIQEFLKEHNIAYNEKDDISLDLDKAVEDGETITIDKAFQVAINDGGKKKNVWTTGGTIKGLLKEEKIDIGDLDKVKPKLGKKLNEDTTIAITRVEKQSEEVEHNVPFKTETKHDNSLEKGKKKVVSKGNEGKVVKTYEITMENGEEVSRDLVKEDVVQESSNKVIAVGTKEPKQNLVTLADKKSNHTNTSKTSNASKSSKQEPSNGSKTMTMTATAYSAYCNGCSGVTRTGINLKANPNKKVVAVDPNVIPLGTRVWVEGYGIAVAADTGGAIKGNRIDLHVPSQSQAMSFGYKKVKVKILD